MYAKKLVKRKSVERNDYKCRAKIGKHSLVHSKINFAITVILIAVCRRVKYEQKSRHRYHVYANLFGKIDEQDVTANIRLVISLSLSRILWHLNIHPQFLFARAIRLYLFLFGDPCSLYFPNTGYATFCATSISYFRLIR